VKESVSWMPSAPKWEQQEKREQEREHYVTPEGYTLKNYLTNFWCLLNFTCKMFLKLLKCCKKCKWAVVLLSCAALCFLLWRCVYHGWWSGACVLATNECVEKMITFEKVVPVLN
jgi:hypothetical protein